MGAQEAFPAEVVAVVKPAMLNQITIVVIPADILPAHIKIVFQHKSELGFDLVRQEFVIVVQKRKIFALRLPASEVSGRPASGLARGMNNAQPGVILLDVGQSGFGRNIIFGSENIVVNHQHLKIGICLTQD